MPNPQIDMVVRDDDGVRWNVCLEAFTWAQRIDVLWRRTDGNPAPSSASQRRSPRSTNSRPASSRVGADTSRLAVLAL